MESFQIGLLIEIFVGKIEGWIKFFNEKLDFKFLIFNFKLYLAVVEPEIFQGEGGGDFKNFCLRNNRKERQDFIINFDHFCSFLIIFIILIKSILLKQGCYSSLLNCIFHISPLSAGIHTEIKQVSFHKFPSKPTRKTL